MMNLKKCIALVLVLLLAFPALAVEWVNGEVVGVNLPKHKATIKHEYIPSIKMEAMTMPFKVAPQVPLENFKVGDKVKFQVQLLDGDLDIVALEKRK